MMLKVANLLHNVWVGFVDVNMLGLVGMHIKEARVVIAIGYIKHCRLPRSVWSELPIPTAVVTP